MVDSTSSTGSTSTSNSFSFGVGILGAIGSILLFSGFSLAGYLGYGIAAIGAVLVGLSIFAVDYHGSNKILDKIQEALDSLNNINLTSAQEQQVAGMIEKGVTDAAKAVSKKA